MKKFINRTGGGYRETVEEMDVKTAADKKELKRILSEYSLSDKAGVYYVSGRACKNWN